MSKTTLTATVTERATPWSLLGCSRGQSAVEYLVICACLITALLAAPPVLNTVHDTLANKYGSYSFGVSISDPPTVAHDQKIQQIIDTLKKWGEKVMNWFQTFFKRLVDFFKNGIPNLFKLLVKGLKDLWDTLSDPKKLLKLIGDTIKELFNMLWEGIKSIGKKIWETIKNVGKAIWNVAKTVYDFFKELVTHPFAALKKLAKAFLGFSKEVLKWFCGG